MCMKLEAYTITVEQTLFGNIRMIHEIFNVSLLDIHIKPWLSH